VHHDLEFAYLGIEVPDPSSLTTFFGDVIGLVPGDPLEAGAATWRNDDKVHRLILEAGPENDATYLGLEASTTSAFEDLVGRLAAAGYRTEEAKDVDAEARRVDRLVRTTSPWGVATELVSGLAEATTPYATPLMPAGFLTEGVGFGHAVFATTAFEESDAFLVDGLGFQQSDWIVFEIAEGMELEVRFYHCNERHHSLALAKAPFEMPQALHHVMFESNSADDVGAAFDRAWATDLAIPNGLGRHDNDRMFSFYVASPAGFMVEVGHGARVVTDDWDDNRRYDRVSMWGHQPLRQS
jgi:2,3-dihydroxybiphenyl 1,2-dioxygenase